MQQIGDWLEKLGMPEYAHRFAENDIDFEIRGDLTDQDLEKIGVAFLVAVWQGDLRIGKLMDLHGRHIIGSKRANCLFRCTGEGAAGRQVLHILEERDGPPREDPQSPNPRRARSFAAQKGVRWKTARTPRTSVDKLPEAY